MEQSLSAFHLSIGVRSLDEADQFFKDVLGGRVIHRDESGYINVDVFGSQITLKHHPSIQVDLPHFHFGFNLKLTEFNAISDRILQEHSHFVEMEPKVVDAGTSMERKKMYLRSPSGYLVELKGY